MIRNSTSTSGALKAEVGSSRIRMRASCATALAISTSCCCPMRRSSTERARIDAGLQPVQQRARPPLLQAMVDAQTRRA